MNYRRERYAIAYGSNLGDKEKYIDLALSILSQHPWITLLRKSANYRTKPVGFNSDNDFINGVCIIESGLHPEQLLKFLNHVERELGRVRNKGGYTDRVIDLDIVLANRTEYLSKRLEIPHPRMHERQFVLEPLVSIAPNWRHFKLNKTVDELYNALKAK